MKSSNGLYKTDTYSIMGLLVNLVGTTAVLFVSSSTCKIARQDGWMASIIAALYGVYVVYVVYRLGILFPGKTFMEYLPLILGKAAGKVLGVFYIIFMFYLVSSVLREAMALFYGTGAYKFTPPIVLAISFIFVTTYSVFSGFEVISRTMSIYWLVIGIVFTTTIVLAMPHMKLEALLPVGEAGLANTLKSTMIPFVYWGELFLLGMILPYAPSPRAGLIAGIAASLAITFFMTSMTVAMVTVLGVATTIRSTYAPFFLGVFIQPIGIKIFLLCMWVVAFWGKIMLIQFMISNGISQILNLKSYHYVVLPVAALVLVLSFSFYKNIPDMLTGIPQTFPGVALVFEYLIPTFLLVIALIRVKIGMKTSSNQANEVSSNT
ncbi:MAG: endospore germination permease [Syntrophomonas sp.]|nr:endospore germination permease [Syntrophomonas sp.]